MDERQRFRDACLLQAAGRLPADEAAWMAQALERNPDWLEDLTAACTLVQHSREALADREEERPPILSFDEVMATLPKPQNKPR